jgi:excisionase family DNA binding protein
MFEFRDKTKRYEMTKDGSMSITQLAKYLGRNRGTVAHWVRVGYIAAHRSGPAPKSPLLVTREEAERFKREMDAGRFN